MSGVIDSSGQQWEHCNGCTKFVRIQELGYEQPSHKFRYGRDLCPDCLPLSRANFACDIQPDPAEVRARAEVKRAYDESMQGKEHVFVQDGPNSWTVHTVDVN
jgi:sarcosine oxidase delta subunit